MPFCIPMIYESCYMMVVFVFYSFWFYLVIFLFIFVSSHNIDKAFISTKAACTVSEFIYEKEVEPN